MIVLFGALGLLLVAGIAVATLSGSWTAFGDVLAGSTPLGIASWLLVPAAIAAGAGFLILRRATARA
jgi:hypothetical protein